MSKMSYTCTGFAASAAARVMANPRNHLAMRSFASVAPATAITPIHKILVIGGGPAGLSISHQLLRSGKFAENDIAVIDPAASHDYQPGWTLVGGGLKTREELRRPMSKLLDPKIKLYDEAVSRFSPKDNHVTLLNGDKVNYDQLVVAPGININYRSIKGLPEALADPDAPVCSTYGYDTCNKVFPAIDKLPSGSAIFTQPLGVIKCAGAPQKIMWLALDHWKQKKLYLPNDPSGSAVNIAFATGLPTMFGVPKYSIKLEELRKERSVEGLFQHDLIAIEGNTAIFARPDGKKEVKRHFDFLHVVPKMSAHAFVKDSELADKQGFVDVNPDTLQHSKFSNVWSAGDASSLPTSRTAAAITSQAPILVRNLLHSLEGKAFEESYDGYTSCPLLTEYGKVMLAEFKYGGVPKETFGNLLGIDQAIPRRAFYHMKQTFFPWIYYKSLVKGTWAGPNGFLR
jgi:NADPH-dependent 2,4-dienoyl-CoA reductase/sulfur reductase-like enzyme